MKHQLALPPPRLTLLNLNHYKLSRAEVVKLYADIRTAKKYLLYTCTHFDSAAYDQLVRELDYLGAHAIGLLDEDLVKSRLSRERRKWRTAA